MYVIVIAFIVALILLLKEKADTGEKNRERSIQRHDGEKTHGTLEMEMVNERILCGESPREARDHVTQLLPQMGYVSVVPEGIRYYFAAGDSNERRNGSAYLNCMKQWHDSDEIRYRWRYLREAEMPITEEFIFTDWTKTSPTIRRAPAPPKPDPMTKW